MLGGGYSIKLYTQENIFFRFDFIIQYNDVLHKIILIKNKEYGMFKWTQSLIIVETGRVKYNLDLCQPLLKIFVQAVLYMHELPIHLANSVSVFEILPVSAI